MTASTISASGKGARSGAQALLLLADPLEVAVLRSLSEGPKRQLELRREAGSPAQSTLRAHLKSLEGVGAIAKQRQDAFPGTVEYGLEKPGEELLFVAATLERWLEAAPGGPRELGGDAGRAAIRALVDGWSSTMLRALASGSLSLTELDGLIGALSYPALERRLVAMRLAGLVQPVAGAAKGIPYAVTGWLRQGVAPLAAAIRWERCHLPEDTEPIMRVDAETGLLLAAPLLRLDPDLSGSCRLAVEIPEGREHSVGGVVVEIRLGQIASCTTRLKGCPDAWICGPASGWLAASIEGDVRSLELGGDRRFARAVLDGLFEALSGAGAPTASHRHERAGGASRA